MQFKKKKKHIHGTVLALIVSPLQLNKQSYTVTPKHKSDAWVATYTTSKADCKLG